MIKVWCDKCKGSGEISRKTITNTISFEKCKTCNGKGYTEHEGSLEDLELAAAVKAAFKKQSTLEIPCGDGNIEMIYQKFELLDWYREHKGGQND